jgi:undecaprenyl pyrophosphate phosphatase UppP
MDKSQGDMFKTVLQVFAILCLVLIFSMIFHKAFADISELAQQHSGSEFWAALAWKVIWNIAAGS